MDSDHSLDGLVHDLTNVFETILRNSELLAMDPKHLKMAATLQRSAVHQHLQFTPVHGILRPLVARL